MRAKMRMGSPRGPTGHESQRSGQYPAHADFSRACHAQQFRGVEGQQGTQCGFIQFARMRFISKMIHIGTDHKPDFTRAAFRLRMPFQYFRKSKGRLRQSIHSQRHAHGHG